MENHTKRIRKARRQGLARNKELEAPTRRMPLRGRGMAGPDVPGAPRPTARRKTTVTKSKAKRQVRGKLRRARSPAARAR